MITAFLLLIASIVFGLYLWSKYNLSYWRRKNIPYIEPNILLGNLPQLLNLSQCCAKNIQDMYDHKNAQNQPVLGFYIFNKPALLIREPELIKSILVKNFNKFSNRYATTDNDNDKLGTNTLFFLKNPHWKELRTKLTPVFSSGKIKQMFPIIQDIGDELDTYLNAFKVDKDSSFIQEVKETCALYTTDVIASVAFGIHANSLQNPEAEFRKSGQSIVNFTYARALEFVIVFFIPQLTKLMKCKVFPIKAGNFIRNSINHIMDERIKSGVSRNDLIDVLIAFRKNADVDKDTTSILDMSNEFLVAQAAIFFAAGYETSSATMSFCLYELSKAPELQKRLRNEIKDVLVKNNGKITYEAVNEMEYLNMVVMEVLRLYPPVTFLDRTCTLASGEEEFSFKPDYDISIPNNMGVFIPLFGLHRDPEYFPDPNKFDPERFSVQNKSNIKPFTYMPFGTGPHGCIGERFGLVQVKIGLINVLKNHYVSDCDKSHKEMVFDPKAMFIQAQGGIYCKFVRDPLV